MLCCTRTYRLDHTASCRTHLEPSETQKSLGYAVYQHLAANGKIKCPRPSDEPTISLTVDSFAGLGGPQDKGTNTTAPPRCPTRSLRTVLLVDGSRDISKPSPGPSQSFLETSRPTPPHPPLSHFLDCRCLSALRRCPPQRTPALSRSSWRLPPSSPRRRPPHPQPGTSSRPSGSPKARP